MTFPLPRTVPRYLRRLVPAALLAAAATLGGSAVGDPATACAVPKEWDVGAYDKCIAAIPDLVLEGKIVDVRGARRECCEKTGGVYQPGKPAGHDCAAPPADAPQQPGLPNVAPQPGEATQNPAPPPPFRNPGVIVESFTPAPASPG